MAEPRRVKQICMIEPFLWTRPLVTAQATHAWTPPLEDECLAA
jgi:hypothetical protein